VSYFSLPRAVLKMKVQGDTKKVCQIGLERVLTSSLIYFDSFVSLSSPQDQKFTFASEDRSTCWLTRV